ncbi:unnamed protein product [Didymodactylos carnosus]|uniref:Uncharacterized protein n=1 Tax=Didymodactylos carnosus TaxID=1234261 RepID=A0A814ED52_9BILA|nr:unnamed protein product [Didymodactylos carnosus]CAF1169820.1 unnamed protein product [Didymodactylos carnosus]CAF3739697.1 unnamed protein product [Didymodactylos carnosus]CAF3981151.1 unnamed protein product [Didymodactylos carnosus]
MTYCKAGPVPFPIGPIGVGPIGPIVLPPNFAEQIQCYIQCTENGYQNGGCLGTENACNNQCYCIGGTQEQYCRACPNEIVNADD